uniref:Uncharacterized protein n=1 Tax=Anguilla anguilla TaxID=7936 RepID=A0A0E9R613_ANGAN
MINYSHAPIHNSAGRRSKYCMNYLLTNK